MFDLVDPDGEEFESLKLFCHRIGEGRLEPQVKEIHYMYLYHPTVPEALLIVYWDAIQKHFYIREPVEGTESDDHIEANLEDLPLVHSFPLEGRDMFPYAVEVGPRTNHHNVVTYHYNGGTVEAMPRKAYLRLKLLFDEINPIPWKELK